MNRVVPAIAAASLAALFAAQSPTWAAQKPFARAFPARHLFDSQEINIVGLHYPSTDNSFSITECNANAISGDPNACDLSKVVSVPGNGGFVDTNVTFHAGTIGDGTCNAGQVCYFKVAGANVSPSDTRIYARVTIGFKRMHG